MEIILNGKVELGPGNVVEVPVKITAELPKENKDGCGIYFILFISILLNLGFIVYSGGC